MSTTRITALWNGLTGLPGYTHTLWQGQLTGTQLNAAAAAFRGLFTGTSANLPNGVSIAIQPVADYISATGETEGHVTIGTPGAAVGGGVSGNYTGGSGAVINWFTGLFVGGREIRGRTFMVPLHANAYSPDGTITAAVQNSILTAASAMIGVAGAQLVIGARRGGAWLTPPVTSASVPDRSAFLRSRRQ